MSEIALVWLLMNDRNLAHLAREIVGRPLLIMPEKLGVIAEVLGGRIGIDAAALELGPMPETSRFVGGRVDRDPSTGRAVRSLPYARTEDGAAIITVTGSLVNRGAWVGASSGLTSYEGINFQLSEAVADPKVRSIVLDLHSPGGQAVGAFEIAAAVRAAASQKPVTAVVNGMAASAAYAIASGATRIITTPSGISGSIGVVLLHADYSRMLDKAGIAPTLIFAGAHKVDGNPYEPLSDEAQARLQQEVDEAYDAFIDTVAAGRRGLSPKAIRATEARTYVGQQAVDAGLADEVGTFETVLTEISRGAGASRPAATRSLSMDNTNTPALTQADLDRAVAQARTEAHAAGAEAGAKAEADRMTAILGLPEAKGREGMAQQLAKTPGMTAEAAKAILDAAPKAAAIPTLDQRAEGIPHVAAAGTGSADKQAEIDKGWDAIISAENEARGLKPPRLGGFR